MIKSVTMYWHDGSQETLDVNEVMAKDGNFWCYDSSARLIAIISPYNLRYMHIGRR